MATRVATHTAVCANSANVAVNLAKLHHKPASVGLIVASELGREQRRREAIIAHLALRDTSVAAAEHAPFSPTGPRATMRPRDPTGNFYLEAFHALAIAAVGQGARVLFTGFGGDELVALRPDDTTGTGHIPPHVPWLGRRLHPAAA